MSWRKYMSTPDGGNAVDDDGASDDPEVATSSGVEAAVVEPVGG